MDQLEYWEFVTRRLRNKDIHEEPMIPHEHAGAFISAFSIEFDVSNNRIRDLESTKEYDVCHACQTSIDVARKLISDYRSL